jgi:hypothetical protein
VTPEERYELVKQFYRARLKEGYKLHEIDQMDFYFYLELMQAEKKVYIDDIF